MDIAASRPSETNTDLCVCADSTITIFMSTWFLAFAFPSFHSHVHWDINHAAVGFFSGWISWRSFRLAEFWLSLIHSEGKSGSRHLVFCYWIYFQCMSLLQTDTVCIDEHKWKIIQTKSSCWRLQLFVDGKKIMSFFVKSFPRIPFEVLRFQKTTVRRLARQCKDFFSSFDCILGDHCLVEMSIFSWDSVSWLRLRWNSP